MAYLICKLGGGNTIDYPLPPRPITIGRSVQADLQISDERISRIHCGIRPEGSEFVVKDLGSTNGTWVNDRKVQEARLKFGDVVRVGHTVLQLEPKPRQRATSRLPDVIEVELPSESFSESMQQISKEAIRSPQRPASPSSAD